MKIKQCIKFICIFLLFPLFLTSSVYAKDRYNIPQSITIATSREKIDEVEYENYTISARRINVAGSNDVAYCLDIDKQYPSSHLFNLNGAPPADIENILAAGYPNKTPQELNLTNEDEAYFATQIAIWCALEGYDVNELIGNDNVVEAIQTIYRRGMEGRSVKKKLSKEYISPNQSIQRVVIVFDVEPAQEG